MVLTKWSNGTIVWGDKTQQASAFADDPNPHVNPQAGDIDVNGIIDGIQNTTSGHHHDGVDSRIASGYVQTLAGALALYSSSDISVTGTAATTIVAAVSEAFDASHKGYLLYFTGFNLRLGTAPANDVVQVWFETSPDGSTWTQRTAKYPFTVRDTVKENRFMFVPSGSTGNTIFWLSAKGPSATVYVRVQAQRVTSDSNTDIFSDTYADFLIATLQA